MSEVKQAMGLPQADAEAIVVEAVGEILAQQGEKKEWGIAEHLALICKVAAASTSIEKAEFADFKSLLRIAGIGGNQSQFRQSKFLKDKLPIEPKRADMLKAYD